MKKNSRPSTAFIKLICTGVIITSLVWASAHFIQAATPAKVLPVAGAYIAYNVFCLSLNLIRLMAKLAFILLTFYLLIF